MRNVTLQFDPRLQDAIAVYDAKVASDRRSVVQWEKAQDLLQGMLSPRWVMISHRPEATGDFSLGYVYGCANMVMEAMCLDRSAPEAVATQVIVFGGVFGLEEGAEYLRRCLDELSTNSDLRQGALLGQEDVLDLLEHGDCSNHWIRHVLGFPAPVR